MRARRVAADVDARAIAAERGGVLVDPRGCAAYLVDDRRQVHAGVLDAVEVDQHEVGARRDEHFRHERIALR